MSIATGPGEPPYNATERPNAIDGAALAAFLAGGVGAFAVGFFVLIHEAGLFSAPSLYGPAGGLSGRATFATVTWLAAWIWLHRRWRGRRMGPRRVFAVTLLLIALGLAQAFPPVWGLLGG